MHVTAFLKNPTKAETGPVIVLSGSDGFLKQAALEVISKSVLGDQDEDNDIGPTRFTGKDADLMTVCDELRTVSMWGDRRIVVIDDADDFVSKNRAGLEKYLERPAKKSVLVLLVKSWPKNTRLAKAVAKIGLDLQCNELSGSELVRWLTETAGEKHAKQLSRDAAALMIELAGAELGLLDQELAKLAAYTGERKRIEPDDVRTLVGGWKAETTWAMLNALRDGNLETAIACLDKLLTAGEAPQRILGGINFVFRKLSAATEISRTGTPLNDALKQAAVFPRDIAPSSQYLRRITRPRAEKIHSRLLTVDGNLKGNSRISERLQLERLLVELSGNL